MPTVSSPGYGSDIEEDEEHIYLDQVNALKEDERLFEAYEVFQKWKAEEGEAEVMNYPVCQELQQEMNDILATMEIINDNEGWTKDSSSSKKISVQYKTFDGDNTVTVKLEGIMTAPLLNLCGLCYEVDLFRTWVPLCKGSDKLGQISRTQQIVKNRYSFPVPFVKDREILMYGYGVNALNTEHKCIMAVGRSVEGIFKGIQIPERQKGCVRGISPITGATFTPMPEGKVFFRFVTNFDPKMKVPYKILNWFSRKFAKGMFKMIEKKANKMAGSEHERRQNSADPLARQFYDRINEAIRNIEYSTQ